MGPRPFWRPTDRVRAAGRLPPGQLPPAGAAEYRLPLFSGGVYVVKRPVRTVSARSGPQLSRNSGFAALGAVLMRSAHGRSASGCRKTLLEKSLAEFRRPQTTEGKEAPSFPATRASEMTPLMTDRATFLPESSPVRHASLCRKRPLAFFDKLTSRPERMLRAGRAAGQQSASRFYSAGWSFRRASAS